MPDLSHTIAFKAVEGAVRNTLHGHPKWTVPPAFANSVAKRAAGTLMAHTGPSLLASARRSGQRRRFSDNGAASGGGAVPTQPLLSRAHQEITKLVAAAHKDGDHGRYIDLITAARILKRELQRGQDAKEEVL